MLGKLPIVTHICRVAKWEFPPSSWNAAVL